MASCNFNVATPKTGTFFFKNRKNLSFSQISQTKSGGGEGAWMTSWCLCTVPTYNEVRCQPSDTLPAAISSALQQAEENLGFQAGTLEVSSVSSSSRRSSSSSGTSTAAVEVQTLPPQQWAPGAGRLVGTQPYEVLAREKEEEGGELKGLLGKLLHGQQLSTQQQQLSTLAKPQATQQPASCCWHWASNGSRPPPPTMQLICWPTPPLPSTFWPKRST